MDLVGINTDGLDKSIRCILCKNNMKTEFGCDGNCVVDDSILANICDEISSRIIERYRWHDLRKNPNDLPNDFHTVLICLKGFEGKAAGVSMALHNSIQKGWGTESASFEDYEVIAWREIEPFEVTE